MNIELMKKVLGDEEFVNSLLEMEDAQQVQEKLKEKGLDFTIEQINEIRDLIARYSQNELTQQEQDLLEQARAYENGELNEEQLEAISGGWSSNDSTTLGISIAFSILIPALAPAFAVGAALDAKKGRLSW